MNEADERIIGILEKENEAMIAEIKKANSTKKRLKYNQILIYRLKARSLRQTTAKNETKKEQKQTDIIQDNSEE